MLAGLAQERNTMTPPKHAPDIPASEVDDPFKYGWRYVYHTLPNGKVDVEHKPLTLEDVLHPEEGDFIVESHRHHTEANYLQAVFEARVVEPPQVRICSDSRIDWGVSGIKAHGPDLAVLVGITNMPHDNAGTIYLAKTGGHCALVTEITSPSTRTNDVGPKFEHYHRVGIPLYVIVDQKVEEGPRTIFAYRHMRKGYQAIPLDDQGRLRLEQFGLWLKLVNNRLVCQDVATGRDYPPLGEQVAGLEQADHKLQEQAEIIEESIEAKQVAERKARAAEEKATVEARARKASERREQKERKARLELEEKVRQLEAQLAAKSQNS